MSPPILYGAKHGRFPATPLDWAACGTEANYRAHQRRGEQPCRACRQAAARRQRDRHRTHARCRECNLQAQLRGLCATHFRAAFGISIHNYYQRGRNQRAN